MRSLLAAVALSTLLLAGCSVGVGGADAGAEMAEGGGDSAADRATGGGAGESFDGDLLEDDARQVVTEGTVTMTVADPRAAAADATQLVEHIGGHVQERVEEAGTGAGGEQASARLVVRIPSQELTRVLEQLERLGTVESIQLTSTDVTTQAQDLDARIRALQLSVARLQDLLATADTTAALVEAERTLTERQGQLESLLSQRARLADQVEMSTVSLLFWTEDAVPSEPPTGFWGGLVTGWQSLLTALAGTLLVLGVLTPWLALGGLILLAVLAVRRSTRRRQAATAPSAAHTSPEQEPVPVGASAPTAPGDAGTRPGAAGEAPGDAPR